ncbi:MAG TPA: BON domain-containing protein [Vicinamibacterales bacterium]|nr:BON domain-containing protein [Vicinamibacterales bacterium]
MDTRSLLSGIAIGAVAASILDPGRGARRRALLRDKAVRATRVTSDAFETTMRDLSNRTRGFAAETRGWIEERAVNDARLLERVRARLGRVSSHPRAIDVEAQGGQVTLRGPVLSSEVQDLLSAAADVRGVRSVINELAPHDSSEGVPALQGRGRLAGPRLDLLQSRWAPATRALVGAAAVAAGGLAIAYRRR